MMERELISVIIPVHNSQDYLHYCVESIRRQTYSPIEIILVENGSSDKSYELCCKYVSIDQRIEAIHIDKAGVAAARNEGMRVAKGAYLVFADSDDYCDENWIESLWRLQVDGKGKYIPVCGLKVVKSYTESDGEIRRYSDKEERSQVDKKDFLSIYDCWLINSPCNKLYERYIISSKKIYMPCDMDLGEDLIFNLIYLDR